jgi:hypothetical protein
VPKGLPVSVPHIPGFRILKPLSEGRRSLLFLAEQESLQRPVALKILTGEMTGDSDSRKRLIEQEKAAARLTHPNILAVFDIGEHDGSYYIATEYVTGGTLRERMIRKSVTPEQALAVTRDLAQGLSFLHEQGFLHRDIKPSNILFREDGTAVLGDTGIMRMEDAAQMEVSFGSPHYMSPEQAQSQSCDGRSDLYSLGVVLFEMFAGRPPFDADDPFQVAIKHISEPPPSLPGHLVKLQPLVTRLLAKMPNERFASAAQLVQVLEQALSKVNTRSSAGSANSAPAPDARGSATAVQAPFIDSAATIVNRPMSPDPSATVVNRPLMPDPAATVLNRPVLADPAATIVNRPVVPDAGATAVQPAILDSMPRPPLATDAATVMQAAIPQVDPVTLRMTEQGDAAGSALVEPVFPPTFPQTDERKFEVPRYSEPHRKSFVWLWILLTVLLVGGGVAVWYLLKDKQTPTITIPKADSSQLAGTAAAGPETASASVDELLAKSRRLQSSGLLVADDGESAASVMAQVARLAPGNPNVLLARQELIGKLIAEINGFLSEGRSSSALAFAESAAMAFPDDPELKAVVTQIKAL